MEAFLKIVRRVGNTFPHPFVLFIWLAGIVLVLSSVLSHYQVSVQAEVLDKATNTLVLKTIAVRDLLSLQYFHSFLSDFTKTYVNFAPLGLVMVTLLVVGYVKETGFFNDLMLTVCSAVPKSLVTFMVVIMACLADMASNAGIIISTVVSATIFLSIQRNPMVGAAIGYAVAHAAEPTNVLLTGFMVTISSISQVAIDAGSIPVSINPLSNYYFLAVAFCILAVAITLVVEKVIPKYITLDLPLQEWHRMVSISTDTSISAINGHVLQIFAIKVTMVAILIYLGVIVVGILPGGYLLNESGSVLPKSPFISGIVPLLVGLFFIVGTVYGFATKRIQQVNEIPKLMETGIKDAAAYLVVCLPAAFAIKFFGDSQLTTVLSVKGAELITALDISQWTSLIVFMLLVMLLNLFVTSGSAKWMVLAPIVIPMFYRIGISPEWTQLVYVIGDTNTDSISLINYYIPVVIAIMERYKKQHQEIGLGDVYALTMPIAITVTVVLTTLMGIWWVFRWPLGL